MTQTASGNGRPAAVEMNPRQTLEEPATQVWDEIGKDFPRRRTTDQGGQGIDELADRGVRTVGDVINPATRRRRPAGQQDGLDHVADVNDRRHVVAASDEGEFAAAQRPDQARRQVAQKDLDRAQLGFWTLRGRAPPREVFYRDHRSEVPRTLVWSPIL